MEQLRGHAPELEAVLEPLELPGRVAGLGDEGLQASLEPRFGSFMSSSGTAILDRVTPKP